MDPALFALLLVCLSLTVTWWAFFRKCVTIRVAAKTREAVMAGYPAVPAAARGWHLRGVLHAEYRYFLTDTAGCEWIVSEAAYRRARAGCTITLRQWVDEWRPV